MADTTIRYRPRLGIDVVVATVLVNVLGLALPIVLLQVYDRIIPRAAIESLTLLVIGLIVALMVEALLRIARASLLRWSGARFERQLRMQAIDHAMSCDLAGFETETPGEHIERMAGIDAIRNQQTGEGALGQYDLGFAAMYLAVIAWISPLVALVPMVMILTALAVGEWQGRRIRDATAARQHRDGKRWSHIIEALGAVEIVKSLGIEGAMERRYDRLCRGSAAYGRDLADRAGFAAGLNAPMLQATTVLVASVGAIEVIWDHMTVGGLAACVLLANRVMQPVLGVQAHRNRARIARHAEKRLDTLFSFPSGADGDRQPGIIREINVVGACINRTDGQPILKDVFLRVGVGQTVAITGPNGAGKSTLMWMLAGDLQPQEGHVLIDGVKASSLSHAAVQQQVGFLTEQSAMLDGTVLENLTRFDPEHNLEAAMHLCRTFGLDRWFAERPEGYDVKVGGGTRALPPTIERQVAFVRALVLRPRIILFDEAAAALDEQAEQRLLDYLRERKRDAAIVIASRRSTFLALADRHYRIDQCRLTMEDEPAFGLETA